MKIGNSADVAAAIQSLGSAGGTQQKARTNAPSGSVAGAATAASASSDDSGVQVDLSSAAAQMLENGNESDSFDSAKVARITQAIAEGRFTVNADAVADKLMANTQEVLGRQQSTH